MNGQDFSLLCIPQYEPFFVARQKYNSTVMTDTHQPQK